MAGSTPPPVDGAQVQVWVGPTAWQGSWKTLRGQIEVEPSAWGFHADWAANSELRAGTRKIRWILPEGTGRSARIAGLSAMVPEVTASDEFVIETTQVQKGNIRVRVYNGQLAGTSAREAAIVAGESARVKLLYVRRPRFIGDRTLLRFTMIRSFHGRWDSTPPTVARSSGS